MGEDRRERVWSPEFRDELSETVRVGAQQMIRAAVEAELRSFLEGYERERDEEGRRAVVRNGYQPEREVLTGVGPVRVRVPKTRDRAGAGRCFRSELLPRYLRKARRVETVAPWLYLEGLSSNDFGEALEALFGGSVKGLSAATITRMKRVWEGAVRGVVRAGLARARVRVSVGGRDLRHRLYRRQAGSASPRRRPSRTCSGPRRGAGSLTFFSGYQDCRRLLGQR